MVRANEVSRSFFHATRGLIIIDGNISGGVQDVQATQSSEIDVLYLFGSKYPQAKEIRNVIVRGTINTATFDPTVQHVFKLSDPTTDITNFDDDGNVLPYDETRVVSASSNDLSVINVNNLITPVFDIEVLASDLNDQTTLSGTSFSNGFKIVNCIITGYGFSASTERGWIISNLTFVADKIERLGSYA